MQQRCPRCKSDRIRRGYLHTPLFMKLVFRYNLLCDGCNWEFNGFAIPGTIPSRTKKRKEKPLSTPAQSGSLNTDTEEALIDQQEATPEETKNIFNEELETTSAEDEAKNSETQAEDSIKKKKAKKRVKVKLH